MNRWSDVVVVYLDVIVFVVFVVFLLVLVVLIIKEVIVLDVIVLVVFFIVIEVVEVFILIFIFIDVVIIIVVEKIIVLVHFIVVPYDCNARGCQSPSQRVGELRPFRGWRSTASANAEFEGDLGGRIHSIRANDAFPEQDERGSAVFMVR
jgi:hypothetical protein